jgi:hypothetical protein
MTFVITWTLRPVHQREATKRFLETGGGPPEGVRMLGRWHASGTGWVVAEAADARSLYEWTARWTDLLEFVITPVVNDEEAAQVMRNIAGS